jgi:uncharacterized protein
VNRRDFALAALAQAPGQTFTPVQLQKFLFILDRNIGARVGGTGFDFQPYHYGPFDSNVYATLRSLQVEGLAEITMAEFGSNRRTYGLTEAGQAAGGEIAAQLNSEVRDYMVEASKFVRAQSFESLVSSIYKAYPEMKVNSVFRE